MYIFYIADFGSYFKTTSEAFRIRAFGSSLYCLNKFWIKSILNDTKKGTTQILFHETMISSSSLSGSESEHSASITCPDGEDSGEDDG